MLRGIETRIKIQNKWKKWEFERLTRILKEGLPKVEVFSYPRSLDFIDVSPLTISTERNGYKIQTAVLFEESKDAQITFYDLRLKKRFSGCCELESCERIFKGFSTTLDSIQFSIIREKCDPKQLKTDIQSSLRFLERVINYSCHLRNHLIEEEYILDSDSLDKQIEFQLSQEERLEIEETPEAFGTIHAASYEDAYTAMHTKGLVPLYKQRDRHSLFKKRQKIFWALPRSFAKKLANCNRHGVSESQFNIKEREILKILANKGWIRKEVIFETNYYSRLNKDTLRYLWKFLDRIKRS